MKVVHVYFLLCLPLWGEDLLIKKAGQLNGILSSKGDAWVEVVEDNGLVARYLAPWEGGSPSRGGGFHFKTLEKFKELVVGNRVYLDWYWDGHLRVKKIKHIIPYKTTGVFSGILIKKGDKWINVPNLEAAVQYLKQPKKRVLLAIGRQSLSLFYAQPQHSYILRLVDPPERPLKFPDHSINISRGPFTIKNDMALFKKYKIELVVAKNSGGSGAYSKIEVARTLGVSVVMVDRPEIPSRKEVFQADAALNWLNQV